MDCHFAGELRPRWAGEMGVSHTLLSLWLHGKRNLAPEMQEKYHSLVTSGYTSAGEYRPFERPLPGRAQTHATPGRNAMVELRGLEPLTSSLQRRRSPN